MSMLNLLTALILTALVQWGPGAWGLAVLCRWHKKPLGFHQAMAVLLSGGDVSEDKGCICY